MTNDELIARDAAEFETHVHSGGWRLGLLVARSVEKDHGNPVQRVPLSDRKAETSNKESAAEFGRRSNTSPARILRYLDAWEKAADAGIVRHAAELLPGMDLDTLPAAEDDVQHGHRLAWSTYYDASKSGGRPRDSKASDAVTIIERRGVREVLDEMPAEMAVEIARAVVREMPTVVIEDRETRRAVQQADLELRGGERLRSLREDSPEKVAETLADHRRRWNERLGIDGVARALRNAAAEVSMAIVDRDLLGVVETTDEQRRERDRLDRFLALYDADASASTFSDDDVAWLRENSIVEIDR